VFQESPRAVGHGRDGSAAEVGRNLGHRLVQGKVGAAVPEEVEEVLAEGLVRIGSHGGVSGWGSVSTAECGRTIAQNQAFHALLFLYQQVRVHDKPSRRSDPPLAHHRTPALPVKRKREPFECPRLAGIIAWEGP
jgi:hypothetical protein